MPKKQWEVEAKDRFLRFMRQQHGRTYAAAGEDVVTNPVTRRDFDYELTPDAQGLPVMALEIFRIVGDEQDLGHHRAWNDVAMRLTAELTARGIKGYLIRTPHFNIPKSKRKQFASETAKALAAAIGNHAGEQEFAQNGYTFYKTPDDTQVRFSYIGGVRQINPFGSVSDALDSLLPVKNDQLNTQGRLRALLILNAGAFPHEERDVRQYFSTKDLEEFPNIDEAFFEIAPGNIALVFDRRVYDDYRQGRLPDDEEVTRLFLPFVEHRLASRDDKAFGITQRIQGRYGNLDHLSPEGKDALISCGEDFAREGEWPSVLWIIEQLKNDPDPPFPNLMHEQIKQGRDYRLIVSVRGRLCWLIQKVVVHNMIEHYSPMLDVLEGYALGPDLYLRSQACVPLVEMAVRRRQKLPDGSRFMPPGVAERIKAIAFQMLRDAGANPAVLDDVSNVVGWIRDITEVEAAEVLDRLSGVADTEGVHNRCALLLYFALFRENQLQDLPRFDAAKFRERLHHELREGDPSFRTSLLWQMAGGTEDKTYPYETIQPYLPSFVAGPYCNGGFFNLCRIFDAQAEKHAVGLCPIMLSAIERLTEYISEDPRSRGWNIYDLQECFSLITKNCGEDCVLDTVSLLLRYGGRIPDPGLDLARILGRYESARAQELLARLSTHRTS